MGHDFCANLDQLHPQGRHRPVLDTWGEGEPTKKVAQVVCQREQLQSDVVVHEIVAGEPSPGSQYVGNSLAKTNMHERSGILNAYLFPDADYSSLYPTITPANTFRVISNRFFKTEFELVEDTTYFSKLSA